VFITCYWGNKIENDETGRHVARSQDKLEMHTNIFSGILNRNHLEDLDMDMRIILRYVT
jgi:hypothetical protein